MLYSLAHIKVTKIAVRRMKKKFNHPTQLANHGGVCVCVCQIAGFGRTQAPLILCRKGVEGGAFQSYLLGILPP